MQTGRRVEDWEEKRRDNAVPTLLVALHIFTHLIYLSYADVAFRGRKAYYEITYQAYIIRLRMKGGEERKCSPFGGKVILQAQER